MKSSALQGIFRMRKKGQYPIMKKETDPKGSERGNIMKWWQKKAVYECYPKSFLDTAGRGTGDLNGVRQKLGYLEKLGVGALWLTPVFCSPMVDNGYDVADYFRIDPRYGTMEDMEALIKEAKEHGIRIVMDLVLNHTSDQNPWFVQSRSSRANPYADWYIWRDARKDGSAPTNWRSIFGGSAWTWCEERGQYYLHTFAPAQPDLNWANPAVRKEAVKIANFWCEKGAGGFRIDAITYIRKPDVFQDGMPDGPDGLSGIHEATADTEGILDYLHEFRSGIHGDDIFMVAEANGVSAQELPQWVGKNGVFDMLMEFSHISLQFRNGEIWCRTTPWQLTDLKEALNHSQQATKEDGWVPVFFENHDQPRSVNHFFPKNTPSDAAAKVLGTLLYTLRGTPFLYQGEELGMTNTAWDDIAQYNDISSHGQYEFALKEGCSREEAMEFVHAWSRDNARTPMQWNDDPCAGFTAGKPWLPVHEDYRKRNAAAEEKDPSSVLNWYWRLAALREQYAVLREGDYEPLMNERNDLIAYRRCTAHSQALILLNWTERQISYEIPDEKGMLPVLSTCEHQAGILQPYEAAVLIRG